MTDAGVYWPDGSGSVPTMPATEQRVSLPPRYRVLRHIADGGMASVWAAEDELLGRLVAVKVLSRAYEADERARRRFLREARAAAKLGDSRHVVTVYDIGEHDDRAFMVMEHFAGGTVADRLRGRRVPPRPLALRWLRETAIALDCAHGHDVVHRDVKPANLLLDRHGRLAVGDFGIATVASEAALTQTGQVLGTAAYISPEQARGLPATAASDRYALAVVAFELLTGTRPFTADHPAAQPRAHPHATIPAASDAADLPAAVDAVLRAGLAKAPEDRPRTAEELVDRLERALGPAARAVDPPTAVTRRLTPADAAAGRTRGARGEAREAPERREPRGPREGTAPSAPSGPGHPRRRGAVAALAALLLAAGAVAAIALGGGGDGTTRSATEGASARTTTTGRATTKATTPARTAPTPTATQPQASAAPQATTPATQTQTPSQTQTQTQPTTPTVPAAGDPRDLNNRGFALIQRGDAAGAVPLLQQSVQGFRTQSRTTEVDYAYALFNLATALRATGHPGDAIPLLEERLKVSNYKRGVVRRELALARREAGQGGASSSASGGARGE